MIARVPLASPRRRRSRSRSARLAGVVGRIFVAGATTLVLGLDAACGADPAPALAEALRQRGWNDTAVDFLEWVATSPLASEQLAAELPYQRAAALAAQARQTANRTERSRMLRAAAEQFAQFAAERPTETASVEALREAANLYAADALASFQQAQRLPAAAGAQREALVAEARERFDLSLRSAEKLLEVCEGQLGQLPKAAEIAGNPALKQRADRLRSLQAEGRFTLGLLSFEQARTYPAGSAEATDALKRAQQGFQQLQQAYPDTLVAATSRYYEGQCLQALQDYAGALNCYQDLAGQPVANEQFRRWAAKAHQGRIECLLALDKIDDAVQDGEAWLAESRPSERAQPEWLAVAFRLAEAYGKRLEQGQLSAADAKRVQAERRRLLSESAQSEHELQQAAREALALLGRGSAEGAATPATTTFASFAEAFDAAKSALDLLNSARLAAELAAENNPEAVAELNEEAAAHRAQAGAALARALALTSSGAPPEDVLAARYYYCWLLWEDGRWHEAAVIGHYIAARHSASPQASGAAKIALAAYEKLYNQARLSGEPRAGDYEGRQLAALAQLIARLWPQSPEASAAANLLIRLAIDAGRLEDARQSLAELPEQSRGAAQISLGSAQWLAYLQAAQGADGASAEAERLRNEAGEMLRTGYASLAAGAAEPSPALTVGLLYLTQYLLSAGDAAGALAVLEDPTVGPLALVESGSSVVSSPAAVQEVYKTALRALLTVTPPQAERAAEVMEALEATIAGDDAQTQITRIYVALGLQLQQQVRSLTDAGNAPAAQQAAQALQQLVARVSQRGDAQDWNLKNWLAQTNLELGSQLAGDAARPYLEQARVAYEEILATATEQPRYAPNPSALLAVRKRLADCLRELGQYERALEQYAQILRQKSSALDLQQAAAEALLDWGVATKNLERIEQSIRGTYPQADGKNLIWGWLQMAKIADYARRRAEAGPSSPENDAQIARYRDLFFEGRYQVARARRLAATVAPANRRQEQLDAARQSVQSMKQLYPDLGGPQWQARFDALLTEIEQARP